MAFSPSHFLFLFSVPLRRSALSFFRSSVPARMQETSTDEWNLEVDRIPRSPFSLREKVDLHLFFFDEITTPSGIARDCPVLSTATLKLLTPLPHIRALFRKFEGLLTRNLFSLFQRLLSLSLDVTDLSLRDLKIPRPPIRLRDPLASTTTYYFPRNDGPFHLRRAPFYWPELLQPPRRAPVLKARLAPPGSPQAELALK